jgi:hypothetical protein
VRTSNPARNTRVAYVERNVFKSNLEGSRSARPATVLQTSSMCQQPTLFDFNKAKREQSWRETEEPMWAWADFINGFILFQVCKRQIPLASEWLTSCASGRRSTNLSVCC